jgi:hypothetical protein
LRSSVRSKRLSTFRLPPKVEAARKLRCCDINDIKVKVAIRQPERRVFITDRRADGQRIIWACGSAVHPETASRDGALRRPRPRDGGRSERHESYGRGTGARLCLPDQPPQLRSQPAGFD